MKLSQMTSKTQKISYKSIKNPPVELPPYFSTISSQSKVCAPVS
jgi:hypothetical protein